MIDVPIRPARADDCVAVVALWRRCGLVVPYNDPAADFDRALAGPASAVLVMAERDGALVGAVMVGHDGHRGWLYYLAVEPDVQREGRGRRLVAAAEAWCAARSIRKVQLMIRPGNPVLPFYQSIGYEETPRTVMAKWLDAEH